MLTSSTGLPNPVTLPTPTRIHWSANSEVHDVEEVLADVHELAAVDHPRGESAPDRSPHDRVAECSLRIIELDLQALDRGGGAALLLER